MPTRFSLQPQSFPGQPDRSAVISGSLRKSARFSSATVFFRAPTQHKDGEGVGDILMSSWPRNGSTHIIVMMAICRNHPRR